MVIESTMSAERAKSPESTMQRERAILVESTTDRERRQTKHFYPRRAACKLNFSIIECFKFAAGRNNSAMIWWLPPLRAGAQ
jgi:hypothetical protein